MKHYLKSKGIIRVIWLNNPFAHLMAYGLKTKESRNRDTKVRGAVLICSCMKPYDDAKVLRIAGNYQYGRIHEGLRSTGAAEMNGYALGIGELVNSRPMRPDDQDEAFVQFNSELWIWEFKNMQLVEPFQYKGKQGWVKLNSLVPEQKAIIDKIKIIG